MKWLSRDIEPVEHGNGLPDFWSTTTERGLRSHLNWPVLLATLIAAIVTILIFLV